MNFELYFQIDECGTQQPIALLKSIFDKQGMYDRNKCFDWKDLVNICIYLFSFYNLLLFYFQ